MQLPPQHRLFAATTGTVLRQISMMLQRLENYFRYIPVRQRDVQWGLYVTGAGCTSILPGESPYPPKIHPELYDFRWESGRTLPEYQLIYIAGGEGVFESAPTGEQNVAAGTVILLFPGVWHRYRPQPKTGWDEILGQLQRRNHGSAGGTEVFRARVRRASPPACKMPFSRRSNRCWSGCAAS